MRALRWEPIVGTAVVAIVATALAGAVGGAAGGPAVQAALVLGAASLAFAADDLVGRVLPAAPTGPSGRLARRLAMAVPVVAGGGVVVVSLARRADLPLLAWPAWLALATAALATGVAVDRWTALASPGAVGAGGVVLVVGAAPLALPSLHTPAVLDALGGAPAGVTLLAALTIVVAQRGRR